MGDIQPRSTTNNDLAIMIGELKGQMTAVLTFQEHLDKAINGNGQPGLVQAHSDLKNKVEGIENCLSLHLADHTKQNKDAKDKNEKIDAKKWAVILIFISQFVGLVFLFVRTGGIK